MTEDTFADKDDLLDLAHECRRLRRAHAGDPDLDFQAMKLGISIDNYLAEPDRGRRAIIEGYITSLIGWLAEWKKSKGLI